MNERWEFEAGCEPERYELDEGPRYQFELHRRNFVKLLGGGVVVLLLVQDSEGQQRPRRRFGGPAGPRDIGAWLHINQDGIVTVYTGKVEVGQNIRTSLSQVVAEELRVPIDAIRMVMADTQLTPYDMGTFGSLTTPRMAPQLRGAAAAAREVLIDLAAERFSADRRQLTADDGYIVNTKTRQSIAFGKLTKGQKLTRTVSESTPTTPVEQWRVAGRSTGKVNGRTMVTGVHRFTSDIQLDGMLYGKVLRPAAFGAALDSVNTAPAEAMADVVVVHDGDFVGVAAPTEFAATSALEAIECQWRLTPQISAKQLYAHLRQSRGDAGGGRFGRFGRGNTRVGSIDQGLRAADVRLEQTYPIAYIAHAPLEPRAAVAEWDDEKLTVWTGTQRPFGVRSELARAFRISDENVRVIVPDTGSGYGGKHSAEAAIEAARLARTARKPVKLVWTREEEFTWAYFRPAGVIDVRSGVRNDGTLTAWEFHNYNSGGSAIDTLYEVANKHIEFHRSDSPLRQGSYRALAATANVFARETHMNELAHAVGMDPLAFRLKNLGDERLRAVFQAAAKAFGWNQEPAQGRGVGIGGGTEKGSYVATCAEVDVDGDTGQVHVVRAVSAFECGAIVNPDQLKNQIEGSMMMGLGGALFEAIEFADGKILNPRFSKYRVPRFRDTPALEVVLVDRKDLPSAGAGETPIVGVGPAIAGAIFAATGKRLRSLPLVPTGVVT